MRYIRRALTVNLPPGRSAFLWGPRKTGKTLWIQRQFAPERDIWLVDLLKTDVRTEYQSRPSLLRERYPGKLTVLDEVQKVPALLDEVHWLIEHRGASFLMTGSSARKLRRGQANLLGGRAWRYEMGPLSAAELGTDFDLERAAGRGLIPMHYFSPDPRMDLRAYVSDYLKEEIIDEALVQNIPAFSEFLRVAALTSGELLNYTNVAGDAGVSAKVIRSYFQILEDTLLGCRLPPWRRSTSRRLIRTDKFYLFDVGVANHLARRSPTPGSADFGKSIEHLVLMEILNYRRYRQPDLDLTYWRTSTGLEVDFILGEMDVAIEVKAKPRIHRNDYRHLAQLTFEETVNHAIIVALESEPRTLANGIRVLPFHTFVEQLWSGTFGI